MLQVITEAVGNRFKVTEGVDIGLFLAGVHAPWRERHRHAMTGIFRRLFHAHATGEHDQVGQGDFLAATVELALDAFEFCQHAGQLLRLVGLPGFLRCQAQTPAVGAAAFVGATERGSRRPSCRHKLRD
ncbi:hypothetical protein D3C87_1575220 [compost metagenome]